MTSKHKLVPIIYAACEIQSTSARCQPKVSYTRLFYIAICSLKHESSTAFTHGCGRVLQLEEFVSVAKNGNQVKPSVLAFIDGWLSENW